MWPKIQQPTYMDYKYILSKASVAHWPHCRVPKRKSLSTRPAICLRVSAEPQLGRVMAPHKSNHCMKAQGIDSIRWIIPSAILHLSVLQRRRSCVEYSHWAHRPDRRTVKVSTLWTEWWTGWFLLLKVIPWICMRRMSKRVFFLGQPYLVGSWLDWRLIELYWKEIGNAGFIKLPRGYHASLLCLFGLFGSGKLGSLQLAIHSFIHSFHSFIQSFPALSDVPFLLHPSYQSMRQNTQVSPPIDWCQYSCMMSIFLAVLSAWNFFSVHGGHHQWGNNLNFRVGVVGFFPL